MWVGYLKRTPERYFKVLQIIRSPLLILELLKPWNIYDDLPLYDR